MRSPLRRASLLVLLVSVAHDLDHARHGTPASAEVVAVAVAGWAATIGLLVLVARGHRLAAPYAAGFGAALALGFVLVHFLPRWSAFSAPYGEAGVDALSWVLAALPVAAGLYLSAHAVAVMRAAGPPDASSVLRNA
jgi:hypothetical protein